MKPDIGSLAAEVSELVEPWEPTGIRAILIWGSTIDVFAGVIAPSDSHDIDIMVICDNPARIHAGDVGLHGMPVVEGRGASGRYDCSLLDLGYVRQAVLAGRWTVVRAVREGLVLRDDGTLESLRASAPVIVPFENSTWEDWAGQARKLLPKAAQLIEEDQSDYAELLIRNAYELIAYANIARLEGNPPTPTSLPILAAKHASSDPVLANLPALLMIDSLNIAMVQRRWLQLSALLGA